MMILTLIAVLIIGCGEEEVPESSATDILGAMKVPDAVAAAPQAPGVGMPAVKEIRYFSDWKLTKEVQNASVGDTIFVKVVFSEPMKHVIADDESARPILYHRRAEKGEQLVRFRMAAHGAGGEDFVSGDAKPLQSGTDDYICKYTAVPEDEGKQIAFMVGKFSVDLENNTLSQFYRHEEKLQVESTALVKPEDPAKSADPEPVMTTDPLTIVSITHYRDRSDELLSEGESVEEGTTIRTEIVFAKPVQADSLVITYPGEKQLSHSTGVHWRGTYQLSRNGKTVRAKLNAPGETFSLVVEQATGRDGSTLKQPVTAPEVLVGLEAMPEPQETPAQPGMPMQEGPTVPATQEPTVPRPTPQDRTLGGTVDLGYTFTFDGHTYPGYNPSPNLQHILDTHPSAKLPHFLEAVQIVEVIDWVYRKTWEIYQETGNRDVLGPATHAVERKFGQISDTDPDTIDTFHSLRRMYEVIKGEPAYSLYWLSTEYSRQRLLHPDASEDDIIDKVRESIKANKVIGVINPNN